MISFFIYTFIPLVVGIISSLFTNMDRFMGAVKPILTPPAIVFPIVWTILYLLIGYSSYRVKEDKTALKLFYIGLAINGIWSIVFFNLSNYLLAFILVLILIVIQIFILIKFKSIDELAYKLNIPYLIWLLFAAYLSLGVYILN